MRRLLGALARPPEVRGSVGLGTMPPTRFPHQPPLSADSTSRFPVTRGVSCSQMPLAPWAIGHSSRCPSPLEREARALTPSVGGIGREGGYARSITTTTTATTNTAYHPVREQMPNLISVAVAIPNMRASVHDQAGPHGVSILFFPLGLW
jgi:hypothetical protein